MNLYIMSRGRAGKVNTLASIPEVLRPRTYLVVPDAEAIGYFAEHGDQCNILPVPLFITNYSQKFQWIVNGMSQDNQHDYWQVNTTYEQGSKHVILDDDLVFSKKNERGSIVTVRDPALLEPLWAKMEVLLDTYPSVGVHPRAQGNHQPPGWVENGRIICIQGFNRRLVGPVSVDQFPILADVRLNLTLLGRGDKNALITDFFQDHGPCQAPGGCSIYRTSEMQERAIDSLVERWPAHVRKVVRKPKVAKWLGETRVEYVAQWKKLQREAPDKEGV